MEGYVHITLSDIDGKYELSAEVGPRFEFGFLQLYSREQDVVWDNDVFILKHLVPNIKGACANAGGSAAKAIMEEWNIPAEDLCVLNELFELAISYGVIKEQLSLFEFSAN